MGQVLGFAHCKESPSTASTTPDSTDGGNDESDFPELQTAREFSEDEDEEASSVDWVTPRELTFSYITFAGSPDGSPPSGDPGLRWSRRDSQTRRARAPLPHTETCETFVPTLGDSLESIPSLCPSPEGEGALPAEQGQGPDPFSGWDVPMSYADESEVAEQEKLYDSLDSSPLAVAAESPGCSRMPAVPMDSPLDVALGDLLTPTALAPCPAGGTPCGADGSRHPALSSPGLHLQHNSPEEEEEEQGDKEPITEPHQDGPDQSGNTLAICIVVADLVYWRDTRTSAFVFTGLMVTLLCLSHFSIISVVSYLSLAALCLTISLRVYKKALQAVHRGEGENPFQAHLDADLGLSKEQLEHYTERVVFYCTSGAQNLRRLFLVEDLVDSIKFALLFYILTYVGAVFNGLTLLILGVISAFSFPLLYRQHQAQIDQYVGLVRNQLSHLRAKIQAKLPSAKAKAE